MKMFGHKNYFFFKYWFPLSIMIINDGSRFWHMTQSKMPHDILIVFWNKIYK
jgi:hypothetical protein